MEGPHGELRSRLTNGLSRNDADRFTEVNQFVVGQGPAVAPAAYGAVGFTGQWGSHTDSGDTSLFKAAGERRIDLCVALGQHGAIGTKHLIGGQSADQSTAEATILGLDNDVASCAAVIFPDDHILSDVHQTAGQITGVSRPQSGIDKTLTGAVGGDHVFRDRQAFTEVGPDWKVNDFTLRVGHQAPHSDQLTHLGHVSPSAGVGHHPHRVQRRVFIKILFDGIHETLVGLRPGVDHLGMAFHLGDFTKAIPLFSRGDLLLGLAEQLLLGGGNLEVVDRDRNSCLGGVLKAQVLELVGHLRRHSSAMVFVGPRHQIFQTALIDDVVSKWRWSFAQRTGG